MMRKFFYYFFVGCLFINIPASAQKGIFSGLMFGDFYWVTAHHIPEIENANGFWFRRIYFTYDRNLNESFDMRLRFEMKHPGDFSTSGNLQPFIKDAYLKWKKGQMQILLGISPTPTWDVIEKIWGYRPAEKTPLDLQKFGSARDFGIALEGTLGESGEVKYHLMLANGSGLSSDTNQGKKVMFSLGYYPDASIRVEIYADWNNNPRINHVNTDWFTLQGFAAFQMKNGRVGLQFAHQTRQGERDLNLQIASIFAVTRIAENTNLFGRIDRMFDPNPRGATIAYIPFDPMMKSTFIVGGVDFTMAKDIHIIPNVETVFYNGKNLKGSNKADVIFRTTFFHKF